jgi:hypothetical protein
MMVVFTPTLLSLLIIPECTNISVGYYSEHTVNEQQDINHLIDLCVACVSVDWESLPVVRDPKIYEAKSYGTYSKSKSKVHSDRDYQYYRDWGTTNFHDEEEEELSVKQGNSWSGIILTTMHMKNIG